MNLEQTFIQKGYKANRIPKFMGSFDEIFRDSLRFEHFIESANENFLHVYNTGWNTGKTEGYNEGVSSGVKNLILSGRNQLFVDKARGYVYPFGDMNELYNDEKTIPLVKDFLKEQISKELPEREKEYNKAKLEAGGALFNMENDMLFRPSYQKSPSKSKNISDDELLNEKNIETVQGDLRNMGRELGYNQKIVNTEKYFAPNEAKIKQLKEKLKLMESPVENELGGLQKKLEEALQKKQTKSQKEYVSSLREEMSAKEKEISKTKKKINKVKNELYKHEAFREKLLDSKDLINANNKKLLLTNTKKALEEVSNPQYKNAPGLARNFREYKPGKNTAIFKSDNFDIYNISQTQKMVNPNLKNGLEDIRNTSYRLNDKYESKDLKDFRTKLGNEERTIDLFQLPNPIKSSPMTKEGVMTLWKNRK